MKNIANLFDNINRYTGYLCAFLVVLMTVNVFIVVFLRYLFGISFIWLQETYVWMHAYIFMAGAGFTYLNDAHVRIDIIYRSSSKVYKAIVDLVGNIFLLMPFLYIIWSYSFPFVYKSFQINEVSREAGGLPMLFLLKAAILIFAFLLFIQALSKLINNFIIIYQK
ncbi:TRAP transporter small permease subunit [Pelagibacteraceae bacterium]|jgi:TRAP-type mannitol/chloroaromatic compound transport system permease small subunit|nr:TRAP transporter small permease subunit [Pelagibacteraceae bacterium]MDC3005547.1 TRAP transporter small permease subunit [Pelagibacteraceae bacterium]|tara:strand:+ start:147 stop:644 length:498 start_codon:yes stop_codon:yes gene_type:complete